MFRFFFEKEGVIVFLFLAAEDLGFHRKDEQKVYKVSRSPMASPPTEIRTLIEYLSVYYSDYVKILQFTHVYHEKVELKRYKNRGNSRKSSFLFHFMEDFSMYSYSKPGKISNQAGLFNHFIQCKSDPCFLIFTSKV